MVCVAESGWRNGVQVDLEGGERSGRSAGKQIKVCVARRFAVENGGQDDQECRGKSETSSKKGSTSDRWDGQVEGNVIELGTSRGWGGKRERNILFHVELAETSQPPNRKGERTRRKGDRT
jgi:hypothetical protein